MDTLCEKCAKKIVCHICKSQICEPPQKNSINCHINGYFNCRTFNIICCMKCEEKNKNKFRLCLETNWEMVEGYHTRL